MAKIELTSMDDLLAQLSAIGERVATRAENKALREGAEVLRREVSTRAPQPPSARYATGKLAENIVKTGVKTSRGGIKYVEVGPSEDVFYGLFLEFGTSKMRAQPFIAPALEEKRSEIFDTMAGVLRKEIEKKR